MHMSDIFLLSLDQPGGSFIHTRRSQRDISNGFSERTDEHIFFVISLHIEFIPLRAIRGLTPSLASSRTFSPCTTTIRRGGEIENTSDQRRGSLIRCPR